MPMTTTILNTKCMVICDVHRNFRETDFFTNLPSYIMLLTWKLMEAVKEAVSYVSNDFVSEMHSTKQRRPVNGCQAIPAEFVLPDYKNITKVRSVSAI